MAVNNQKSRKPRVKGKLKQSDIKDLADTSVQLAREYNPSLYVSTRNFRLVSLSISCIFFLVLFLLFTFTKDNSAFIQANLEVLPLPSNFKFGLVIAALLLSAISFSINLTHLSMLAGYKSNPANLVIDPLWIPKSTTVVSTINITLLSISLLTILYLFGIVSFFFQFLQSRIFPGINSLVNMILANIVGWVFAAVIGNFVYDFIKWMFTSRGKQIKSSN